MGAMTKDIFSVQDKTCLVTGGSSGLGAHMTRLLLDKGAHVTSISTGDVSWDASAYGDQFSSVVGDVRDETMLNKLFGSAEKRSGSFDVVINNAGITFVEKSMKFDSERMREILDINVVSAGRIASMAAQQMRTSGKGGSIINVTSVLADSTIAGLSSYAAAKAALTQLTRGMAAEWARHGVRVNNLAPGWFPSKMTNRYVEQGIDQVLKARIPMSRLGEHNELDGACLLLASDASRYMTGTTITVDGGFSLIN